MLKREILTLFFLFFFPPSFGKHAYAKSTILVQYPGAFFDLWDQEEAPKQAAL